MSSDVLITLYLLGPAALFLLLLALLTGRERRKKAGKPPRSMKALAALVFACLGLLWLSAMGAMTCQVGVQLAERLAKRSEDFLTWITNSCSLPQYYDPEMTDAGMLWQQYEDPARFRWQLLEGAAYASDFSLDSEGISLGGRALGNLSLGRIPLTENENRLFDCAVLFLDGEGEPLFTGDVLYFYYASAEQWAEDLPSSWSPSCGWVQLPEAGEGDAWRRLREARLDPDRGRLRAAVRALRITAPRPAETGEFFPAAVDMATREACDKAASRWTAENGAFSGDMGVDDLDRTGYLEWEHLFGDAEEAGEDQITVYALVPELSLASERELQAGAPLILQNALGETLRYESAGDMLLDRIDKPYAEVRSLRTVLTVQSRKYRDRREGGDAVDLIVITAAAAHPLRSAAKLLWLTWLLTALLALGLGLLMLRLLRRRLVDPIRDAADSMAGAWPGLRSPAGEAPVWAETAALWEACRAEQDFRRKEENEIRRLERVAEYARAAEEERRLLTSNLAHELKTPLAVVHSYAEGLRERIAEEKREQYLDTILSEAERMDALVMQMLDLSRLEAGKVKLSRDEFDLRALAAATAEKLGPLAAARDLTVTLAPGDACAVTADEGRIAQAAENLITNALRYAPAGSRVRLRAEKEGRQAVFRVENPVEKPFSPEEREKVWEPFYRRDKARSGGGTGLGLSIVRQIVELHGGTCGVRNTVQGVEFFFTLPL